MCTNSTLKSTCISIWYIQIKETSIDVHAAEIKFAFGRALRRGGRTSFALDEQRKRFQSALSPSAAWVRLRSLTLLLQSVFETHITQASRQARERLQLLLLWGGGMLVPWGEQAKAGIICLRAAWGSFRSVPKAKDARTHRHSHFYFLAAPRAYYIYKPSRRVSARACSRAPRGDDVTFLNPAAIRQTTHIHTNYHSGHRRVWQKSAASSAPDAGCLLCTAIYAFFSLWPKRTGESRDAFRHFQLFISGANYKCNVMWIHKLQGRHQVEEDMVNKFNLKVFNLSQHADFLRLHLHFKAQNFMIMKDFKHADKVNKLKKRQIAIVYLWLCAALFRRSPNPSTLAIQY